MAIDPEVSAMLRNVYYASIHQISEADYNCMINDFFGALVPPPKQYSGVKFLVEAATFDNKKLRLNADFALNQVNTELSDELIPEPFDLKDFVPTPVFYSVQFLRGLNFLFDLDKADNKKTVYISKSRDADGKNGLVMKIVDQTSRTLYFGDLTNMLP
jgi:hypothetical protein